MLVGTRLPASIRRRRSAELAEETAFMRYVLQDLLNVRQFREDTASQELLKARNRLAVAEQTLLDRQRELREYIAWRVAEEEKLYAQIMRREIQRKELDDLKLTIQELRDRELSFQENILKAEKAIAEAKAALQQAQAAYRDTVKAREKLDEHKAVWTDEQLKEVEFNTEKETEDFRPRDPDALVEDDEDDLEATSYERD